MLITTVGEPVTQKSSPVTSIAAMFHGGAVAELLLTRTCRPGGPDWVVVCSDGLSNHVPEESLKEVLQTSASAETAARRLVNFANLAGAADNATVVVIRVT